MPARHPHLPALSASALRNFPAKSRYLIGVSGGRDSVALLHLLKARGFEKLIVCHLDHQLRGRSSAADAKFVARLADSLGCSFVGAATDVRKKADNEKLSIELAARTARYEFFAKVARQRRCSWLFLAHHADDLVETFLINLFRGTGKSGLVGIREISKREISGVNLTIVRPLLAVWRSEIDRVCRANRWKFRDDLSNRDLAPLRNRIRHRVIPYLEKTVARNIRASIWRAATIASEEENFLAGLLPPIAAPLAAAELRALPVSIQRRTLRDWLRAHEIPDVGFELVERVRALADLANNVSKTNLPRDRHARRRAGKILIE